MSDTAASKAIPRLALAWGEILFVLILTLGALGILQTVDSAAGDPRLLDAADFESRESLPDLERGFTALDVGWKEAVKRQVEQDLELEHLALRLARFPLGNPQPPDPQLAAKLVEDRRQLEIGSAWAGRLAAKIAENQAQMLALELRIAAAREKASKELAAAQQEENRRQRLEEAKFCIPLVTLLYLAALAGLQFPAGRRLTKKSKTLAGTSAAVLVLILVFDWLGFAPIVIGAALAAIIFLFFYTSPKENPEP